MATKFCPDCGDEFVSSMTTCPDCDVPLGDERPDGVDDTRRGEIEYELHEWAAETRVMLESLLAGEKIPHAWEAANLLIPAAFEARVDGLVEQVAVTAEPQIDPDAPKVAYDVADWTDEQQTELVQALDARGISYEIEVDGSLIVLEADEAAVDTVLDDLGIGDDDDDDDITGSAASGAGDDDGDDEDGVDYDDTLDAQDVLSDLFVAADRLAHKATDHEGVLTMVRRADDSERMRLPYGFNRRDWKAIVSQAGELRDLIGDDEADDADIKARAVVLRGALRNLV